MTAIFFNCIASFSPYPRFSLEYGEIRTKKYNSSFNRRYLRRRCRGYLPVALPFMSYTGMCSPKGYGFQPFWS